jgi:hypothetical protein
MFVTVSLNRIRWATPAVRGALFTTRSRVVGGGGGLGAVGLGGVGPGGGVGGSGGTGGPILRSL